ncbi:AcrR family transcriptional regulator [Pseudomonas sp. JAI111]|uniref:TetR/AcrR family transcriptional regulator n=1 Tax=Pseudomonas sp. JAI111 TaxID=2735913 RepID=UPI0021688281|nr:TetR/AcrR family transcriptional regulator [Pseudomonas sp. JAI111]MCS3835672.1 AcrR family transcriptional regulator [Pseudomonas sp. JAI111]
MTPTKSANRLSLTIEEARRGAQLRTRKNAADQLREAAISLFIERGYDAVTVNDIVETIGVTSRTFFRHFPSKEIVVTDIYDGMNARLLEFVRLAPQGNGIRPATEFIITRWAEEYSELGPLLYKLLMQSESLSSAMLLRGVIWQNTISTTLAECFPEIDKHMIPIWSHYIFSLMQFINKTAMLEGKTYADSARAVIARLETFIALFQTVSPH